MNASDNQLFESYVPVYDVVPERWEQARPFLVEHLKKISNSVNIRVIGWYLDEELLSGKAFIPGQNVVTASGTSQQYRQVLRKVIDFGDLPNNTNKDVPHGINFDSNFTLVSLEGAATDPVGLVGISLPHSSSTALGNNVALAINAVNVVVTTGSNRSNFTRCFVTIEYMQEL